MGLHTVPPAYPSVRMLLTAPANHNTCLGEITEGSARVLKGLCVIKSEVSVWGHDSHIHTGVCGAEKE